MRLKGRLTYANVMSSIAVFLVLGGATAFAASQLGRNSVGTKQLKRNAVTVTKIKKNAVTGPKIKKGAIGSDKIADGAITGADINPGSTSFSQVTARIRATGTASFKTAGTPYQIPNASFTQNAGEDNQLLAALTVNIPASCTPPRIAQAYLVVDPANPGVFDPAELAGIGVVQDKGTGSVTRTMNIASYFGAGSMSLFAPPTTIGHTVAIFMGGEGCGAGSGITASAAGIDVIGTK
jgi:hypothetical protein